MNKIFPRFSLIGSLALSCLDFNLSVQAQITPDSTVGTFVNGSNSNACVAALCTITGGNLQGTNLFHSFSNFSLTGGNTVQFNNGAVTNTFVRITGGQVSNLDGIINASNTSNLFLLNPNGIAFGSNAQLNISGSFFASTADRITFTDNSFFSATDTSNSALLTVTAPVGLQIFANPGSIINRSTTGLAVNPGQNVTFVGGEIGFEGANLTTLGGKVQLVSTSNSTFNLNSTEAVPNPGKISLTSGAMVNTSGLAGGGIILQGGAINLTQGSSLVSDTFGNLPGAGIDIQGTEFKLESLSYLSSSTFLGTAKAGDININSSIVELNGAAPNTIKDEIRFGTFNPLALRDGLYSLSLGGGAAGKVKITANQLLSKGGAAILTTAFANGAGGDMDFNVTGLAEIDEGSIFLAGTAGVGASGSFEFTAGQLRLLNGSVFSTTPNQISSGKGGDMTINAGSVEIRGTPANATAPVGLFTTTLGGGAAGNLKITTGQLVVAEGGQLSSATSGAALGGNLDVIADVVDLRGISPDGIFLSGLFASSSLLTVGGQSGNAAAGNLTINSKRVSVRDGAQISVATGGSNPAGSISIKASESVEVSGFATGVNPFVEAVSFGILGDGIVPSAIDSNTSGAGAAGNIDIHTKDFRVENGAEVGVRATSTGGAGNLNVQARRILLDNQGTISAATVTGAGGNIRLNAIGIILRRNSRIATDAGNADGGNIIMETGVLAALENSDITANAQQGRGGRVIITAEGIFGTEFRAFLTPQSDITATSDLGPQFSGVVDITTLGVDPSSGLVELPDEVVDPTEQIAVGCATSAESRFIITGRGGLPEDAAGTIRGETIWQDLQDFSGEEQLSNTVQLPQANNSSSTTEPLPVQATGWVVNESGNLELVAHLSEAGIQGSWADVPECGVGS